VAYRDDILALNPDHHWVMDGITDLVDLVGTATLTNSSMVTGAAIAEDTANSISAIAVAQKLTAPSQNDMNLLTHSRRVVSGWFRILSIQKPPTRIYGEGDNNPSFQIVLGYGNNLMFEAVDSVNFDNQVFGDRVIENNRPYHLCMKFSGNGFSNQFTAWLDGVELTLSEPVNKQVNTASFTSAGSIEWADPASTVGVGGDIVLLVGPNTSNYNHWSSWSGANAELITTTEVRTVLFEKGALPEITIASGTQSVMQTSLDSFASSSRINSPLTFRINAVTGDGNLSLSSNNITFDSLTSIHIQYMGTGILTWTNNNGSNASIGSTPANGTIIFVNPVIITITVLNSTTFSPVQNAQVLVFADTGGDLVKGTTIISGITDNFGVISNNSFGYTNDQPVKGRVRKGTVSPFFVTTVFSSTILNTGLSKTVLIPPDSVEV